MENSKILRLLRKISPDARISAIEALTEMSTVEEYEAGCAKAETSSILVKFLTEQSKDVIAVVRYVVAYNPRTPARILTKLAKDEDLNVRAAVAGNPRTPPAVLTELSKDEVSDVLWSARKNPSFPK